MFPILLYVLLVLRLPDEVIATKSSEYIGTLNTTILGMQCQRWDSNEPHKSYFHDNTENYCRDPSGSNYLWCYTTDPKVRWDICDPRALTEDFPYISTLSNTTGSNCVYAACCNVTWESFRSVHHKCNPRMFQRILIMYRLPEPVAVGQLVFFIKKYVVTEYFTYIFESKEANQVDCAIQCLNKPKCNGFVYIENLTSPYPCLLGMFNSPRALETLSDEKNQFT